MTGLSVPTLETKRLILRGATLDDYGPTTDFLATDRTRYIGGKRNPMDAWRSFAAAVGHWALRGYGFFIATLKEDGTCAGHMGPHQPGPYEEIELGWSIWHDHLEGTGLAFEGMTAVRDWAQANVPYAPGFVSYIDPDNARSIALAKRLGARLDAHATHPFGDAPCLIYRHPAQGAA